MQCSTLHYSTVPYGAEQCITLQCRAVQCSAVQCSSVRCSAVQCSSVRCSAVRCSALHCSAVQCSAVRCARWCPVGAAVLQFVLGQRGETIQHWAAVNWEVRAGTHVTQAIVVMELVLLSTSNNPPVAVLKTKKIENFVFIWNQWNLFISISLNRLYRV